MDNQPTRNITVETSGGQVVVKKLALKDYAEFIRALRSLPAGLANLFKSGKDMSDMAVIFQELPEIIADGFPDFINLLAVVTDKDPEFFNSDDFDLADAIEIIRVALELNDYEKVVDSIKKIMGRKAASNMSATPPARESNIAS